MAPLGAREFFERYWDQRAVHVAGEPGRFEAAYPLDAWKSCRAFRDVKGSRTDETGVDREQPLEPGDVHAAFASGAMICADVSADPQLQPLLLGLRQELQLPGWPPFAKLYASTENRGFQLHFDQFHVFVMQLLGKKRWRFSKGPAVQWPPCGGKLLGTAVVSANDASAPLFADDGTPLRAPEEATLEEVVLEPGHLLYLPPGTWHRAYAVGSSVAVSVSPPRSTALDLVLRWLQDELVKDPRWRRDVYPSLGESQQGGAIHPSVARAFAERLEALKSLDVRGVHRVWRLNVGSDADPVAPQPAGRVEREHVLTQAVPVRFLAAPLPEDGREALFVYHRGAELVLPGEAMKFIRALEETPRFRAGDACAWDPSLKWEEIAELLGQLLGAGLLSR